MSNSNTVLDDIYKGDLVSFPGPWRFQIGRAHAILTKDSELDALANEPDRVLNLACGFKPWEKSLRQICEEARAGGRRTLIIAFDQFMAQYRPGQDEPRRLMPDMDEYISKIAAISRFAAGYGLGLERSLLSPLEVGKACAAATGKHGMWMHYRKGLRDPRTGRFSVQLWQQRQWVNNKGPFALEDAGVRVFAFKEKTIGGTPYKLVLPGDIVEIMPSAQVEAWDGCLSKIDRYEARRVRVHGEGSCDAGDLDRVMVVQQYRTPEMDYFSADALPYLKRLVDKYADAGVKLNALYADEMHIQQDWCYYDHHDNGQFALRYVSDGFAGKFAERYGAQYKDFAKYLVYFIYGQEDFGNKVWARDTAMHVWGETPEAIRETALFRSRYYRFLHNGVVDLFTAAKRHAEERFGRKLESRAHATWAESPTCDRWETRNQPHFPNQYEYTPNFLWSNTVHQAAAACDDYFKWNDFLTGGGNDHAEGGWADRDYWGLALGVSTGILNDVPYAYAGQWGMPHAIHERRNWLAETYGALTWAGPGLVQNMQHRDIDVLMLYPLDLVAAEERFGTWMTQYGYANLVPAALLAERGRVKGGAVVIAGRRFSTIVATFEPFPPRKLLEMMKQVAVGGGRAIWSGPPPVLTAEGDDALVLWQSIFGVTYKPGQNEGEIAPGRRVEFTAKLKGIQPQTILTDFMVDRVYPVAPCAKTAVVARVCEWDVGTVRKTGKGIAAFLGFRPRDDQSASLGYEMRTWFEALCRLGVYPKTGSFRGVNDNTEYLSRTTGILCCRFPNGALGFAPHMTGVKETWDGNFSRDREKDKEYERQNPPPSDRLVLRNFKVNGRTVTYSGRGGMTFRTDAKGNLAGFLGRDCTGITVDGQRFVFCRKPAALIVWGEVAKDRRVDPRVRLQAMIRAEGEVAIPTPGLPAHLSAVLEGTTPGSVGEKVACRIEKGRLVFDTTAALSGKWIYVLAE